MNILGQNFSFLLKNFGDHAILAKCVNQHNNSITIPMANKAVVLYDHNEILFFALARPFFTVINHCFDCCQIIMH